MGDAAPEIVAPMSLGGTISSTPAAVLYFFDTGHFALETHAKEIAGTIRDFLAH